MITVLTTNPQALNAMIKKGIDEGHIKTWTYDKEGDYTHSETQWANRAWLRPVFANQQLKLIFLAPKNAIVEPVLRGIYHGRFIEMLISHFGNNFSIATATAVKAPEDLS